MFKSVSSYQWTPLYWATMGRHMNTVICLVEEGADIHSKDDFGVSEGDYTILTVH